MSRPSLLIILAILTLAFRLAFLPKAPDDIDAVNFTLGVRDFDVTTHQPHPPGYPMFVALGKIAAPVIRQVSGPNAPAYRIEAQAVAVWSIVAGALSLLVFPYLFLAFEGVSGEGGTPSPPDGAQARALWATLLTVSAPLIWLTAGRPMSDVPGLLAGTAAMALLATALWRQQALAQLAAGTALPGAQSPIVVSGRLIVAGAFVAGLAIGMRSQTAWMTVPLLVFVLFNRIGRGAAGAMLGSVMTFSIGVLLWAVPLLVATGGPAAYVRAFRKLADEDLAYVPMLAFEPDAGRLASAVFNTFVAPWQWVVLGCIVIALASFGGCVLLVRNRRGLLAMAVAFVPYTVFHLLFQDTRFVRYALPLIPAIAYLAVCAIERLVPRRWTLAAAVLVVACLVSVVPLSIAYAREPSPAYQGLTELQQRVAGGGVRARLSWHQPFALALRGEDVPLEKLPILPRYEWFVTRGMGEYWRAGGTDPIWFFADPKRSDALLQVDYQSRRLLHAYRWSFRAPDLMRGVRPDELDWHEIDPPGWFVGEGWAFTPELAGIATRDRKGLGLGPIEAYVQHRDGASVLLLGGRNLGRRGDPDIRVDVTFDGRSIETLTAAPDPGFFLHLLTLPAGALSGTGRYGTLRVTASRADGTAGPVVAAVEQFDVQPDSSIVVAFDTGWHEPEYNPTTGRRWRWSSASATTRVHHAGQDLVVTIEGESPRLSFSTVPRVVLRAGAQVLAQAAPAEDFTITARVPAAALDESGGTFTLETDQVFVPAERSSRSRDRRPLGLRIYRVDVKGASGVR